MSRFFWVTVVLLGCLAQAQEVVEERAEAVPTTAAIPVKETTVKSDETKRTEPTSVETKESLIVTTREPTKPDTSETVGTSSTLSSTTTSTAPTESSPSSSHLQGGSGRDDASQETHQTTQSIKPSGGQSQSESDNGRHSTANITTSSSTTTTSTTTIAITTTPVTTTVTKATTITSTRAATEAQSTERLPGSSSSPQVTLTTIDGSPQTTRATPPGTTRAPITSTRATVPSSSPAGSTSVTTEKPTESQTSTHGISLYHPIIEDSE